MKKFRRTSRREWYTLAACAAHAPTGPGELEALDKQASQDREAGRNARLDMAAESSADRAAETMEEMLQEAGFSREGELALAPARASL